VFDWGQNEDDQQRCEEMSEALPKVNNESVVYDLRDDLEFTAPFYGFDECFEATMTEETDEDEAEPIDYEDQKRGTNAGEEWMICNYDNDLTENKDPCNQINEENVACRGEESCAGQTMKANVLCTGEESCKEATFKPQRSTDTIQCLGESACEDATGKERKKTDGHEEMVVYTCSSSMEWEEYDMRKRKKDTTRDACRGAKFMDNTLCNGETACEDSEINAKIVTCEDEEEVCADAKITAEVVTCSEEYGCEQAHVTGNQVQCADELSCVDATIALGKAMGKDLDDPRVDCVEGGEDEGSCFRTTFNYKAPIIQGNESLRCLSKYSCQEATIKVEAHCMQDYSCHSAFVARDVICATEFACQDTHMSQGTICCGPGCANANTKDEFGNDYEEEDDEGCLIKIKKYETHEIYEDFECKRCGKETMAGWITASKTNLAVAIVLTVFVLLIVLGIIGFILVKTGCVAKIFGGGSTEDVEVEA
jgi:hypothetical protein